MGRHSAPDEPDEDDRPDVSGAVRTERDYRPRRARPDPDDTDDSELTDTGPQGLGLIDEALRGPAGAVASDETTRIEMVVDTEIDAPVPEAVTAQFQAIEVPEVVSGPAPVQPPATGDSDLDLIRGNSAVRARVIAAVLVPFVLYTAVLFGLSAMSGRTYLIWIWVPLVSAGVLAGLILDAAHRGRGVPSTPDVPTTDERAPDAAVRDELSRGEDDPDESAPDESAPGDAERD